MSNTTKTPASPDITIDPGAITSPVALYHLTQIMLGKQNVLVSGAAKSGKSTLVQELAKFTDPLERAVIIEDYASATFPAWMKSLNRLESQNRATTDDLIRTAAKMRVQRIILDELRGSEADTYLRLANQGTSTLSSIHATDPSMAIERLISLACWEDDTGLTTDMAYEGIDILVHISRDPQQRNPQHPRQAAPRVIDIYEVNRQSPTAYRANNMRPGPGSLTPIYLDPRLPQSAR